jgi:hypothetical protein
MTTMQSGKTTRKTSTAKSSAVKTGLAGAAPAPSEPLVQQKAEQFASAIPQEDWRDMVATAAYYRAQARGFEPGSPEQDWYAAENELKQRLGKQ